MTDLCCIEGGRPVGRDDDYNRLLGGLAEAFAEPKRRTVPDLHFVPPLPFAGVIGLAAIRRKSGLSQPTFARRIGVPLATLRNWEGLVTFAAC